MECKARMYLHRPLAALSNKACIIRKSIQKSNRDFLCLLRIKKQTEILNQTRSDRFYYNKAISSWGGSVTFRTVQKSVLFFCFR